MTAGSICEQLVQQSPGCAWALNRNHAFELVYGDAAACFCRAPGELRGAHFADVFAAEERETWDGRIERVFSGSTVSASTRPAGCGFRISITLFPVRTEDGAVFYAGGVARHPTERDLAIRLLRTQEQDRTRLSKLLHDRVGQYLSAAGLQLDLLRMDLGETPFPISQRTGEIQAMLETVMELVREINHELSPGFAERVGLRAALDRLAGRLRSEFTGTVRVLSDATARLPAETAAALYRIAQEAAWNAVRHSGCSAIEILLKSVRSGFALEVRDNGRGFDAPAGVFRSRGLGLLVMEQCAEQAGIGLEIESAPGKGTVVRARSGPREGRNNG